MLREYATNSSKHFLVCEYTLLLFKLYSRRAALLPEAGVLVCRFAAVT